MKILLITETLHPGGAETFVVRLANRLVGQHDVVVVNLHPELSKRELMSQLNDKIELVNISIPFKKLFIKADRFLFFLGIDFSLIELTLERKIRKSIESIAPAAVHSHLFKTDYYVSNVRKSTKHKFNHVTTNHGDYLLFEARSPVGILNYPMKLNFTLRSLDIMVMISDAQINWLNQKMKLGNFNLSYTKVINGYELNPTRVGSSPPNLKKDKNDFVFGMVARGIRQKGWESVIKAFKLLDRPKTKLYLVGEGTELDRLKKIYLDDSSVLFVGYKPNPIDYIKFFDVCLLPTYYEAESLPTVIIEYLTCRKPILTTDIGEIKHMLTSVDNHVAGLFVNHHSAGIDENDLLEKMKLIYEKTDLRENLSVQTESAIIKFDMEKCVLSYLRIYGGN